MKKYINKKTDSTVCVSVIYTTKSLSSRGCVNLFPITVHSAINANLQGLFNPAKKEGISLKKLLAIRNKLLDNPYYYASAQGFVDDIQECFNDPEVSPNDSYYQEIEVDDFTRETLRIADHHVHCHNALRSTKNVKISSVLISIAVLDKARKGNFSAHPEIEAVEYVYKHCDENPEKYLHIVNRLIDFCDTLDYDEFSTTNSICD